MTINGANCCAMLKKHGCYNKRSTHSTTASYRELICTRIHLDTCMMFFLPILSAIEIMNREIQISAQWRRGNNDPGHYNAFVSYKQNVCSVEMGLQQPTKEGTTSPTHETIFKPYVSPASRTYTAFTAISAYRK